MQSKGNAMKKKVKQIPEARMWSAQRRNSVPVEIMNHMWSEILCEAAAFIENGRSLRRAKEPYPVGSDGFTDLRQIGWDYENTLQAIAEEPAYEIRQLKKERAALSREIAKWKRKNKPAKRPRRRRRP